VSEDTTTSSTGTVSVTIASDEVGLDAASPTTLLRSGERVAGRYRVERRVGKGGYGEVYRVRDTHRDDRVLALKLHRARFVSRLALSSLRSEFGLLSTLSHPHLARVHDFAYVPGEYAYFTQAFIDGVALHEAGVDPQTPTGAALLVQLCRALDHLHSRGIVHGDVKPSNVLVDRALTHLTLLDFGVSRMLEGSGDEPIAGSPPYMAPELVTGGVYDPRTDLYALGVTLYRLVSGQTPFRGPKAVVMRMQVEDPPPDLPPSVPIALRALIARLLAKDPDDRPASAAHVLAHLARIGGLDEGVDTEETLASHLLSAPAVGRVGELFELSTRVERAEPGAPPVLLTGAAGAGKSRLIRELRRRVQLRGQPWIQVEVRRGRDDVLVRLARAVLDRARLAELSDEARLELARGLPELLGERERLAPAIDPDLAWRRRLEILGGVIARRFEEEPGMIAVEDLHWASERELEGLLTLVEVARAQGARSQFVLVSRDGAAGRLEHPFGAERMECAALRPRESRALVEAAFGDAAVLDGTELGDRIDAAPSSALWLQESLRLAIESRAVVRRAGRFERVAPVAAAPLEQVLDARLGRLSALARQVALGLAVLDEPRDARTLRKASGLSRDDAGEALADLVRTGIVERQLEQASHVVYAMHDRYAQHLLEAATDADVRAARRRVGRWLARRGDEFRDLARAARELELAGEAREAREALSAAATLASEMGRPERAVELLRREAALRASDDPAWRTCLTRMYDLAVRSGLDEAAGEALMELAEAANDSADPELALVVGLRGARQALRDGDLEGARAACEEALVRASDPAHEVHATELTILAAKIAHGRGEVDDCIARYEDAAERARALRRPDLEATAMLGVALVHVRRSDAAACARAAARAVAAAEDADDPVLRSDALRTLGNARLLDSRRTLAARAYRDAVQVARQSGGLESEAKALNNLATVALTLGSVREAFEAWDRAVWLKERVGAIPSAMVTHASRAGAQLVFGQIEAARASQQRVLDSPRTDHGFADALAWSNRGDVEVVVGRLDAAIEAYDRGSEGYRRLQMDELRTHALTGAARARLMRAADGDVEEAAAIVAELVRIAELTESPADRRRALSTRALLCDARGAPDEGLEAARAASSVLEAENVYEDVFASSIDTAWIVAVLLGRLGRGTERAVERAQRRLTARAEHVDEDLREPFLRTHPLHRAVAAGVTDSAPGTAWVP